MAPFCGSAFWDSELTWNSTNPYFTSCFEATALTLSPFFFLLIFGIIDILNVRRSKFKRRSFLSSFNNLTCLKALLTLTLVSLQLAEIIRFQVDVDGSSEFFTVDYLSPSLQALGYVVVLGLSLMTQYHMIRSSGVQFFFWLGTVVTQAILFRTAIENYANAERNDETKLAIVYLTRLISFPVIFIRFLLEWLAEDSFTAKGSKVQLGKPSPEKTSTFISKLLFLWYDNLAWTGYRRTLTKEDLWDLNPDDTSRVQIEKFSKSWRQEEAKTARNTKKTGKESLAGIIRPIIKCYGLTYSLGIFFKLTSDMLVFVQPEMLSLLVAHVSEPELEPVWKGYFYMAIICTASFTQSILNANSNKRVQLTGMRVRTAISNAVFRKALVISNTSKKDSSVGEIVNLQSVDSNKLMEFLVVLNFTIGGPLQILISIVFLYDTLGPSIFAGVGILITLIPLNMVLVTMARKHQMKQMKLKDERLKLTSEAMNGIKVLKLYAWEPAYQAQIEAIRQKEMVCLRKIANLNIFSVFIFQCTPIFVSLASFLTYVLSDPKNVLNAEKTFVSMSLFNIMRLPMAMLPHLFSTFMQASVSVKRLNKFLNMEELDRNAVTHGDSYKDPIVIQNGTLSWTPDNVTLKNVNFSVKNGELVAIVGTIGSGKTSLLSSLLGDLTKHSGVVNTKGDLAYVSQSSWIQNATVRDNILFGDKFNQMKYSKAINACALEKDLEMLSSGDQTEIGEKGINLSGGQKQRVALARAAYKDASIYLFDDPLSAVDSHVGKHIFDNLIGPDGLLKNKTRVLVTHAISFLPRVDRIFVMKNGEISETGSYKELLLKQGEFAEILLTHLGVESNDDIDPDKLSIIQDLEEVIGAEMVQRRSSVNRESLARILQRFPSKDKSEVKGHKLEAEPVPKKLIEEEISAEGNIKLSIFVDYFKSAGILMSVLAVGFAAVTNGLTAYSNIWLSNWSTEATKDELETGTTLQSTTDKYLTGYGLLGTASGIATLISAIALALVNIAAARTLHTAAISRVMRAPMSYFDTTPTGRLINRFSKDVDTLDNIVPSNLRTFLFMFLNVFFTFVVISYTTPEFIGFIIPMIIFYFFLQRFYVATSRQLKRLEGVSRSPIYSHFGEAISGSSIIRAFQLEEDFITESEKRVDLNQKSSFPFIYSNIWISIRLEFIGVLIILSTCVFILISRGTIDPGDAGLAISYSLQVTSFLNLLARQLSDLEANIVSVERVGELTQTPQEPAWEKSDTKPSASWPENGNVVFSNYMTRYREGLELVLRGVSCTLESGEKIGVVGRTGAGKSSLTLALFRIVESAGGKIVIDGIDISTLGLHDLRKKITIIPQDPVLFSGTLRLNLDPFNQYADEQVWRCLELAHLKSHIATLHEGLNYHVEEEGQNFSVGQRQLICLARALLRKTKILVLDEATAAVDLETDDLIQATIRKEFADCTVITIAHRLNTIMDSNRVLVLDKGEIKEFDSPESLLEDTGSIFWGMAHDAKLV